MSRCCGFASMQHQACRALRGQECMALDKNSKIPSCHAWLMKTSQSRPSGFLIRAQLILPARSVTGLDAGAVVAISIEKVVRPIVGRFDLSCSNRLSNFPS